MPNFEVLDARQDRFLRGTDCSLDLQCHSSLGAMFLSRTMPTYSLSVYEIDDIQEFEFAQIENTRV